MTAGLSPFPIFRAFDANGVPLVGGLLNTYQAGTAIKLATYTDETGGTPQTNPVVLDSTGSAPVWLGSAAYKFILTDSVGNVQWSADNIQVPNINFGAQSLTSSTDIQLTNPLSTQYSVDITVVNHNLIFPAANTPNSIQKGLPIYITNTGAAAFTLLSQDLLTSIGTLQPGATVVMSLMSNSTANGTWNLSYLPTSGAFITVSNGQINFQPSGTTGGSDGTGKYAPWAWWLNEPNSASHTYGILEWGGLVTRSNTGSNMTDTLPIGGAALPNGWYMWLSNLDASGVLNVAAGAGAILVGVSQTSPGSLTVSNFNLEPGELGLVSSVGGGEYFFSKIGNYPIDPVQGSAKNLKVVTTSNTAATITADSIVLREPGTGRSMKLNTVSQSYATGTVGAGGLDTGTLANNTWYHEYIIFNMVTNTISSLFSLSSTAPTLPTGYTFLARVGAFRIDGSAHILWKLQFGKRALYVVGTNPTAIPVMASGSQADNTAVAVAAFVPTTATSIIIAASGTSQTTSNFFVAANASSGTHFSATNPPPIQGAAGSGCFGILNLESSNIYVGMQTSSVTACYGWEDNI